MGGFAAGVLNRPASVSGDDASVPGVSSVKRNAVL
ncbi:hypothetical protein BN159_2256 [Streptomyces davaonensis JCM 4913]|uniref:Uncharacterized protein n=1 Tax=Streptomyces davaonensis (strain DSM 101723 / JCM 4913 / KCC S-0913 / 768) TaxID=1214101 RepID=K4R0K1_STRDJ|nr:hypothetical protein BN159_2256 [Streptomyces davaonensis JCM 4913]